LGSGTGLRGWSELGDERAADVIEETCGGLETKFRLGDNAPVVVGVFSVRRRPDLDEAAYQALDAPMWDLVSKHADFGFIGIAGFKDDGGRSLAMAFFENREGCWPGRHRSSTGRRNGADVMPSSSTTGALWQT
jgi:hypothetical protein